MNEVQKHAAGVCASATGFIGSITLSQVNEVVSLACGIAGFIAACLTIYSWCRKNLF